MKKKFDVVEEYEKRLRDGQPPYQSNLQSAPQENFDVVNEYLVSVRKQQNEIAERKARESALELMKIRTQRENTAGQNSLLPSSARASAQRRSSGYTPVTGSIVSRPSRSSLWSDPNELRDTLMAAAAERSRSEFDRASSKVTDLLSENTSRKEMERERDRLAVNPDRLSDEQISRLDELNRLLADTRDIGTLVADSRIDRDRAFASMGSEEASAIQKKVLDAKVSGPSRGTSLLDNQQVRDSVSDWWGRTADKKKAAEDEAAREQALSYDEVMSEIKKLDDEIANSGIQKKQNDLTVSSFGMDDDAVEKSKELDSVNQEISELYQRRQHYAELLYQKKAERELSKIDSETWEMMRNIEDPARSVVASQDGAIDVATDQSELRKRVEAAGADYDVLADYAKTVGESGRDQKLSEMSAQFAKDHPVAASIGSVPIGVLEGVGGTLDLATQKAANGFRDTTDYRPIQQGPMVAQTIRGTIGERLAHNLNESKIFGQDLESFLYQTGMSAADSAFTTAATMGLGSGLGLSGQALKSFASAATTGTISMGAVTTSFADAKSRGLDDNQAFSLAVASGLIEAATEKFSVEALLKEPKSVIGYIAENILTEASEETVSEVAGKIADVIIAKDRSEWSTRIAELMESGMTEAEATSQAFEEAMQDVLASGLGGALSGGAMAGGGLAARAAIGAVNNRISTRNQTAQESIFAAAQERAKAEAEKTLSPTANPMELAQQAMEQSESVQEVLTAYDSAIQQSAEEAKPAIQQAFQETAREYGISADLFERKATDNAQNDTQRAVPSKVDQDTVSDQSPRTEETAQPQHPQEAVATTMKAQQEQTARPVSVRTEQYAKPAEEVQPEKKSVRLAQARITESGTRAVISGVSSVTADNVMLETASGKTVALSDISFDDPDVQSFYNAAAQYDMRGANAFLRHYSGNVSLKTYQNGFNYFYNAGQSRITLPTAMKNLSVYVEWLGKDAVTAAYNTGANALAAERASAKAPAVTGIATGKFTDKTSTGNSVIKEIAPLVAEKFGVDIDLVDTLGGGNGSYLASRAKITIAADAENVYAALTHELGEHVKAHNREGWEGVASKIVNWWAKHEGFSSLDDLAKKYQSTYAAAEGSKTYTGALDEMLFDALNGLFSTDDGIRDFLSYLKSESGLSVEEQKTVLQRLVEFIERMISEIKELLKDSRISKAAQTTLQMEQKQAEAIRRELFQALEEASDNYRKEGKKKTASEGGETVKHSINPKFEAEYDKWDKKKSDFSFKIGSTSSALKSVGVKKQNIRWDAAKIKKIKEKHPAMTDEVIKQVPHILEEPILIMESQTVPGRLTLFGEIYDARNHPVLAVLELNPTDYNGHSLNIIKIASAYGKDTNPQRLIDQSRILYVDPNKKRTDSWLLANRLQLPFASTSYGSIDTITSSDGNVNSQYMQKSSEDSGEVKHSLPVYDYSIPFSQQLKDYQDGKIPNGDTLVVGETPQVFERIGFNKLPVTINTTHVDYALNGTKGENHALGMALLSQLPDALKKPVAVITSATHPDTSVVALLPIIHNGDTVIAPVLIDGFGKLNNLVIDSNAVTSIHGRSNAVTKLLNDAINDEASGKIGVFYINKKEASALLHRAGLQLPGTLMPHADGFLHSIRESGSPVNMKMEDVTYSQQFKRWFGDWEKHPDKASKVVDEDGKPLVVYHGTSEHFTVFDSGKARSTMDIQGNFFSPWELDAQGYGENVGAYYLSIKNPAPEGIAYRALNKFKGQNNAGVKAREYLESLGYDGVNNGDEEYIAFYPEQIKSATDNIGTFDPQNPDIRYSLPTDETPSRKQLLRENEKLKQALETMREQFKLSKGHRLSDQAIKRIATRVIIDSNSMMKTAELTPKLRVLFDSIANGDPVWGDLVESARVIAGEIVEKSRNNTRLNEESQKTIREIRSIPVSLSEEQKRETAYHYGSYGSFRKKNFGRLNISDQKGVPLESRWLELAEMYPSVFDTEVSELDMPVRLAEIVSALSEDYESEYGFTKDDAVADLTYRILDEYWNVPEVYTWADKNKKKIDALKAEQRKKVKELRQELKDKYDTSLKKERAKLAQRVKNVRDKKNEQLLRQKVKFLSRQSESRAKRLDTAERQRHRRYIIKQVKALDKLLRHETDQKHIPEGLKKPVLEFLKPFANDAGVFSAQMIGSVRDAYESLDENLSGFYDEDISENLKILKDVIGDKRLSDLSAENLKAIRDIVDHFTFLVKNENEIFVNGRKQMVSEMGEQAIEHLNQHNRSKISRDADSIKGVSAFSRFLNSGLLKPVYFFKQVGGPLQELYQEVRNGENAWAVHIQEARKRFSKVSEKTKYKSWAKDGPINLKTDGGHDLELSVGQAMSIYALSRREQGLNHLIGGGIVLRDSKTMGESISLSASIPLTLNDISKIIDSLTEEQREFTVDLQSYLSSDVAEWGNETSLKLFGIRKFNESTYFPIMSESNYLYSQPGVSNDQRIKHTSCTKRTLPGANNPVSILDFTSVWANHVDRMALYNALALPLENFNRVYNYYGDITEAGTTSVASSLESAYGRSAINYVKHLIEDINGGVQVRKDSGLSPYLIRAFKKNAVMASASVIIQQPSSIGRAVALIGPQHFVTKPGGKSTYDEMKKYAPVVFIKELGRFDTNTGMQTTDYLTGVDYSGLREKGLALITDSKYRDDVLSRMPAKADEITWTHIWQAVKQETKEKHPDLTVGSEEYFQECGRRFTEVVDFTQVYDSVFSRSDLERNPDTMSKVTSAFMAEPITSYNMLRDGIVQGKRGDLKYTARAFGAYALSVVMNSLLKAFVQAGRDDDDKYGYWEKYLGNVVGNLIDDPLSMIPYVKDIISLMDGYDTERLDMSLFSDLIEAFKSLQNENKDALDKIQAISGAVGAFFGIPVKNIWRDVEMYFRDFSGIFLGTDAGFNGRSLEYSILENLPKFLGVDIGTEGDRAYAALLDGDMDYYNRMIKGKTGDQVDNMLRKALKENEPRVLEGAKDWANADSKAYMEIVGTLKSELTSSYQKREGLSDETNARIAAQNDIVSAIVTLGDQLRKLRDAGQDITRFTSYDEAKKAIDRFNAGEKEEGAGGDTEDDGILKTKQVVYNLEAGDMDEAKFVINEIIESKSYDDNGVFSSKLKDKARGSIKTGLTSHYKPLYQEADSDEKARIRRILTQTGLYSVGDINKWNKKS